MMPAAATDDDDGSDWTTEHERIFTDLVRRHGTDWASITAAMNARFGGGDPHYHLAFIQQRWRCLQPPPVVVAQVVPAQDLSAMMMRTGNPWTPQEEAYLAELVRTYGNHWTKVARIMQHRFGAARTYNLNSIKRKWKYMVNSTPKQRPPTRRAPLWTEPEERFLAQLVNQHGRRWTEIADRMTVSFGHVRQYTDKKVQAKWRSQMAKSEQGRAELLSPKSAETASDGPQTAAAAALAKDPSRLDLDMLMLPDPDFIL